MEPDLKLILLLPALTGRYDLDVEVMSEFLYIATR